MKKNNTLFALTVFSLLSWASMAQGGIKTADFKLTYPANPAAGAFFFSFQDGKLEWKTVIELEKRHGELLISADIEYFLNGAPGAILSMEQFDAILNGDPLPDIKPMQRVFKPDFEHVYVVKDDVEEAYNVFMLKDASKMYSCQTIQYARIPDGMSWKQNPDLIALRNSPISGVDGMRMVIVSDQNTLPNLAEGTEKKVMQNAKDLKAFFPAAAKEGDFLFHSRESFQKDLAKAGCDYFKGTEEYPRDGAQLLLCLNKRCAVIPDDKVESLCSQPAKLVGDYYGVPMDISTSDELPSVQPMVLMETSSKKLFLIVGINLRKGFEITYFEIARDGISQEQAKAIREYLSRQKTGNQSDAAYFKAWGEYVKGIRSRKEADSRAQQARQDAEIKRRIEAIKPTGETFPNTQEEINLVYDLIGSARYDELIELCEGKNLDFNKIAINPRSGMKYPLLYPAIAAADRDRFGEDLVKRMNRISEFLLKNGAAAVIHTEWGRSCAREAAYHNNKEVFDLLLENGYDLNQKDPEGKTLLDHILQYNRTIDPEIMNKIITGTQPSLFSMVKNDDVAGLKKALEDKDNLADLNKQDSSGKTLLDYALKLEPGQSTNLEIVKMLIDAGAAVNYETVGGIIKDRIEILSFIWEHYHDRLSEDEWNKCFSNAALSRNTDVFKFFLDKGLDPEKGAIDSAYQQGTREMLDLLEARGFKKPFWAAVKWNDLELVKEYLAAGADVNAEDNTTHHPPIYNAVENNLLEMAELLIKNGANPSPKGYREWEYPMEAAATIKNGAKMTELLLKNGFVPDYPKTPGDTKHPNGSSALYRALFKKNYDTAKILLKYGARTDLTEETEIYDREQRKTVKIDAKLEELFKDDPKALEVLKSGKGFLNFL